MCIMFVLAVAVFDILFVCLTCLAVLFGLRMALFALTLLDLWLPDDGPRPGSHTPYGPRGRRVGIGLSDVDVPLRSLNA